MDSLDLVYGSKTISQFLGDLVIDGLIDNYAKGKLLSLNQRLSIPNDLSVTKSWLAVQIPQVRAASTQSCVDQYIVLSVFQSYYQVLKYFEEIAVANSFLTGNESAITTRSGECNFWSTLGCVLNEETLISTIKGALVGCNIPKLLVSEGLGAVMQANSILNLNSLTLLTKCGIQVVGGNPVALIGLGIGATVGLLIGIVSQWEGCKCDCDGVTSFTYRYEDCTPVATFRPWGYGDDIVSFDWNNTNGDPITANTLVSDPTLRIRDVSNTSEDLGVLISPNCIDSNDDPMDFALSFDLQSDYIAPRTILLSGGPEVDFSTGTINYRYAVVGLHWVDLTRYNVFFWAINGTIISSSSDEVVVNWDGNAETGKICIDYWINCPGGQVLTKTHCRAIIIDDDIL